MGHSLSDHSESPVRSRVSPRRRSPYRSERSPARHRSLHAAREKPSSRTRSPKPVSHSPVREKPSNRTRSPKHAKSRSPVPRLPVKEKPSSRTRSPMHTKLRSSESRSPSPRTKRLRRAQAESEAEKISEREHERNLGRGGDRTTRKERDLDREVLSERRARKSGRDAVDNGSPSPRTKRLRRAQAESEAEKISEKEDERNHGRGGNRAARKESDLDREVPTERREKKSGRDAIDNGSSKSRHVKSTSPSDRHKSRRRSRSPPTAANTRSRDEMNDSRGGDRRNEHDDSVAQMKATEEALETKEKQKPSYELSGKLAAETNRVKGVTLLFSEPPDARKPEIRWRLYVFKGGEVLNEPLYVHRQTYYLFGRERRVADIPTDHPSCSKQHAVLQYRQVEKEQPDGTSLKQPRICTPAREFSWMMVIIRHVGDIRTFHWEDTSLYLCRGTVKIYYLSVELVDVPILQYFGTTMVFSKVTYNLNLQDSLISVSPASVLWSLQYKFVVGVFLYGIKRGFIISL